MAASSQRGAISQSKEALLKSYTMRLRGDVQSMLDNFLEIIKLAKEDSQLTKPQQTEQDQYEMQVRAANMVRAGESLTKLVSDLKQYIILNDFSSVNDYITQNSQQLRHLQNEVDSKLMAMRDDMAVELYDLEQEYYSSAYK